MVGFCFSLAWSLTLPSPLFPLPLAWCVDTSFADYNTMASDFDLLHAMARPIFCKDSLYLVISHFRTLPGILSCWDWTPHLFIHFPSNGTVMLFKSHLQDLIKSNSYLPGPFFLSCSALITSCLIPQLLWPLPVLNPVLQAVGYNFAVSGLKKPNCS